MHKHRWLSPRSSSQWIHAFCLALLLAAACAPMRSSPAAPRNAAGQGVGATLADLVVAAPRGLLSNAIEAAAAAYTQVEGANVRVEPFGGEEYARSISAALLAGLPRYDLVYLSTDELAKWAGYHAIQPITGGLDRAALSPWLPAVTVGGEVYGLPTQPDPEVLWVRTDLLKEAGLAVPTEWEMLRRAAGLLKRDPQWYGMVTAGSDIDACLDFAAVLAGFGGEMVSTRYQVEIEGETARRALETYIALSQPGAGSFSRANVQEALRDGRAALGIAPFSAGAALLDCSASPRLCRDGKPLLAWARLPGLDVHQAVGSLGAWTIPLRAAHASQAQRFAAWLGSEEGARAWAQAGETPAHTGVLASLEEGHPLSQVTSYRQAFPPVAAADRIWKACNSAVNAAVSGKQPPYRALEAAAAQMRQVLRQAGHKLEE